MVNLKKILLTLFVVTHQSIFNNRQEHTLDRKIAWSSSLSNESAVSLYTTLLNKNVVADRPNYVKSTLDISPKFIFGRETFGHDAIVLAATMRHKSYWGSNALSTDSASFKVEDVLSGAHSHPISRPSVWMKNAYAEVSFDAFVKSDEGYGANKLKVGYFPFSLGRGIAFGGNYGVSQDFLGVYIRSNDYSMPGMLFHGEMKQHGLGYKFYFSKPDARSASLGQTLGLTKDHLVNEKAAYSGAFKDDMILAIQFDLTRTYGLSEKKTIKLSPYAVAFVAPDKKVVMDPDSSIELYTCGLAGAASSKSLEFSFDTAINFGQHTVKRADQNTLVFAKDPVTAALFEQYSQIIDNATGKPALATDELKNELLKNRHRGADLSGETFSVGSSTYRSKPGRVTQGYTNKFKGYMSVVDASFKFNKMNSKLSGIAGLASGDANPHGIKKDKDYNGFIGINESFNNDKVPSSFFLGGGVRRPLTVQVSTETPTEAVLKDYVQGAFTDLYFTGVALNLNPGLFENNKDNFSFSILTGWKHFAGKKVIINENSMPTFSNEDAASHLGVEINSALTIMPIDSFKVEFKAACFIPGQYYRDMSGAIFDDSVSKALKAYDSDSIVKGDFSLGSDKCFIFGIEASFSF